MNNELKNNKELSYFAFSAPSGAGKTTIIKKLLNKHDNIAVSISATTRPIRKGEIDGVDYYFTTQDDFKRYISERKFLEFEPVHNDYYGTLIEKVESLVKAGKTVLFDIDVNGALKIKKNYPETVLVFIKPPSREALIERLRGRKSETEDTLKKRMERLDYEYSKAELFDYIIINDNLDDAVNEIESIIWGKS